MLVFNLLVSVFRINYVDVEYIECYANYKEKMVSNAYRGIICNTNCNY